MRPQISHHFSSLLPSLNVDVTYTAQHTDTRTLRVHETFIELNPNLIVTNWRRFFLSYHRWQYVRWCCGTEMWTTYAFLAIETIWYHYQNELKLKLENSRPKERHRGRGKRNDVYAYVSSERKWAFNNQSTKNKRNDWTNWMVVVHANSVGCSGFEINLERYRERHANQVVLEA